MDLVDSIGRGGPPQEPTNFPVCPRCGGTGHLGLRPVLNRQSAQQAIEEIQKLRRRRIRLGVSQKEVATAMRVPLNTFINWETRNRAPRPRSQVARYREVLDALVKEYGVKEKTN